MKLNQLLNRFKEILSSAIFYLAILIFIIGFNFSDTPLSGGWTQQFMPDLGGATITDITFLDSLSGFAVTSLRSSNDSAFILKTTNGGDNWNVRFSHNKAFVRVRIQVLPMHTQKYLKQQMQVRIGMQ